MERATKRKNVTHKGAINWQIATESK